MVVPSIREVLNDIYLPVIDESVVSVFVWGLGLPLHSNLRGLSGVKDELSEVFFINQILKVPSEGETIHCEVSPSIVKDTILFRSI